MTPRPSSAASNEVGHQRMPFAHAEALLWWPELRKQHAWLLSEMRALQTQHDAYNTRIQTTEAVAEVAEAAISRIRHVEQQIVAIEADDKDKAFEKWAAEEITRLKIFADRNQTIRQKQIELEKSISNVTDEVSKFENISEELRTVQQHLHILETGRKEDSNRMRALEQKIISFEAMQRTKGTKGINSKANMIVNQISSKSKTKLPSQNVHDSEATTETEDEDLTSPRGSCSEQIPEIQGTEDLRRNENKYSSETRISPAISARLRLLRRPSIHNSKILTNHSKNQRQAGRAKQGLPSYDKSDAPSTQIVNRNEAEKPESSFTTLQTERITRSQARNDPIMPQQPIIPTPNRTTYMEPTKRPSKLQKAIVSPTQSGKTPYATQSIATRSMKRKRPMDPGLITTLPPESAQLNNVSSQKRRKPNNVSNLQVTKGHVGNVGSNGLGQDPEILIKSPPKIAVLPQRSCQPCRQRHQACDRAKPVCGQCVNRSQANKCHYIGSSGTGTPGTIPDQSAHQKNTGLGNNSAVTGPLSNTIASKEDHSRLPQNPVTEHSTLRKAPPSVINQAAVTRSARRAMPVITDYDTYLKLRADHKIP